jgi:lipopolysaccharide/colanic/teichoic acid biosynthesis glycosyltransferase
MTDVPVYRRRAKQALDGVCALAGLTLGLPLLAALALGVWLAHGRPVLHVQRRVGRGGREFKLHKLRTLPLTASAHADREWTAQAEHPYLAWLRRTGLDETPQLWNVLRGEMSLVGPRPERPYFVEKLSRELPHYRLRLQARPGITGWAQVQGMRGDTSIARRLELDLDYLRRQSFAFDLRIIARTAAVMALEALGRPAADVPQKAWPTRSTSSTF